MYKLINYITLTSITLLCICCRDSVSFNAPTQSPLRVFLMHDSLFQWKQDTLLYRGSYFTGITYSLHSSGDTSVIGTYVKGQLDGWNRKWFTDGQLMEERFYRKGKKEGLHKGYWENHKPRFEYAFVDGEHHGSFSEWYQNGQLFKQMNFVNGYEEGSQRLWWENGSVRANYVVKNGRRYGLIGLKLCSNPDSSTQKRSK